MPTSHATLSCSTLLPRALESGQGELELLQQEAAQLEAKKAELEAEVKDRDSDIQALETEKELQVGARDCRGRGTRGNVAACALRLALLYLLRPARVTLMLILVATRVWHLQLPVAAPACAAHLATVTPAGSPLLTPATPLSAVCSQAGGEVKELQEEVDQLAIK